MIQNSDKSNVHEKKKALVFPVSEGITFSSLVKQKQEPVDPSTSTEERGIEQKEGEELSGRD